MTPSPIVEVGSLYPTRALILMDCFCEYHGLYLARKVQEDYPDVALVFTISNYLRHYLQTTDPDNPRWFNARLAQNDEQLKEWKEGLHGLPLVGVYCESDSGLDDAEWLREKLMVSCQDDPPRMEARRHKYLMNQAVHEARLVTVQQKLCGSLQEAVGFGRDLLMRNPASRIVVKPHRGVATESVHVSCNDDQTTDAWNQIVSTKVFGSAEQHSTVLVQEFLEGEEYAVDVVARDGEYKVAAVWKYDKRPANGAPFCYFRTNLVDCDSDDNVNKVVEYVKASLQALGIRWGLSHNEVIVTADRGPVLVEVNCRQHNMDFLPLVMACIGYNALDMTLMAMLGDEESWRNFPNLPTLRASGCMVHLVNYATGTLRDVRYLDELASLPSVASWEVYGNFQPGEFLKPTIDIRTDAGWVQLVNSDIEQFEHDYKAILDWMPTMFCVDDDAGGAHDE
ncbi:hypothetical protein MPSEU_001041100 [Mayamaea pseudoterrestris]|nr:hypothetical protein MPSEU_001041100 [Mayamaea pseudoterrestris]